MMRPQSADWACAYGLQKVKPRRAVEKARFFAAFGNNFRKQIDHAVVGSVDTAGNIR